MHRDTSSIQKVARLWSENAYFDPETQKEVKGLLSLADTGELTERFYRDLEFGTGGLRGLMGAGTNRLNRYTVRRATDALILVLKKYFPNQKLKIVVGHDSRHNGRNFAEEVAGVCVAHGVEALLFPELTPVPFVAYGLRYFKAQGGIMLTASHNPRDYNGFKAYWADGGQVTPPYDQEIIEAYNRPIEYADIPHKSFAEAQKNPLLTWIGSEVADDYFKKVLLKNPRLDLCRARGSELKVVYTPLHGTGLKPISRALKELNFTDVTLVEAQTTPDGDFPTAPTPNPELPETLKMATDLLLKIQGDVAFATDPDTDRIGVVVRHKNRPVYLSGNDMGLLLLDYILKALKEKNQIPPNALVFKTIVTSPLQEKIAQHYGVKLESTLTGFKWMAARMREIEAQNIPLTFLYANEESYGHLTHNYIRDKDAISAVMLFSEMALWYKTQGKTLIDGLEGIFAQFGLAFNHLFSIHYLGIVGAEKINRIMDHFRKLDAKEWCQLSIVNVEDYVRGTSMDLKTRKELPLNLPKSNVLGFMLKDEQSEVKLYLRPSGTEPKIKFYIMIQVLTGDLEEKKKRGMALSDELERYIKSECDKA